MECAHTRTWRLWVASPETPLSRLCGGNFIEISLSCRGPTCWPGGGTLTAQGLVCIRRQWPSSWRGRNFSLINQSRIGWFNSVVCTMIRELTEAESWFANWLKQGHDSWTDWSRNMILEPIEQDHDSRTDWSRINPILSVRSHRDTSWSWINFYPKSQRLRSWGKWFIGEDTGETRGRNVRESRFSLAWVNNFFQFCFQCSLFWNVQMLNRLIYWTHKYQRK